MHSLCQHNWSLHEQGCISALGPGSTFQHKSKPQAVRFILVCRFGMVDFGAEFCIKKKQIS